MRSVAHDGAARPRLRVYDAASGAGATLAASVLRLHQEVTVDVVAAPSDRESHLAVPVDVVAIEIGGERCDGLAIGGRVRVFSPWVEEVFWYDAARGGAAAAAARSLGLARVLSLRAILDWLPAALPALTAIARARRALHDAQERLPPLPEVPEDGALALALPEAERRFREAYLRGVLSESRNHRLAARKAGVPYTTLCSMLRKLDLA